MPAMYRLTLFLGVAALALAACGSPGSDKQWYKPIENYTAADFERDRVTCTDKKTKVLGDECMQQRGWNSLGADIGSAVKAPDPSKSPYSKGK